MSDVARSQVFSAARGPAQHRLDLRVRNRPQMISGFNANRSISDESSNRVEPLQATKREATMLLAGAAALLAGKDLVSPPSALSFADTEQFGNITFNAPSEEAKKQLQDGGTVYAELNYTLANAQQQTEFINQYQQVADFGKQQPGYLDITLFKVDNGLLGAPTQYFTFAKWASLQQFLGFFGSGPFNKFKQYIENNNITLVVNVLTPSRDVQDCI